MSCSAPHTDILRRTTRKLNLATPEHQPIDEKMPNALSLGWNTGMAQQFGMWATVRLFVLTHFQFQTAELFTAWVSSDRQAALYADYVPQSPSGLGALLGLRHQVSVRSHVRLRGPTQVHSSTVFGHVVVLSHLGYGRRRPWYFLKYITRTP